MYLFLYMTFILYFSCRWVALFLYSQGIFISLFLNCIAAKSHINTMDSLESLLYLFFKDSITYKS